MMRAYFKGSEKGSIEGRITDQASKQEFTVKRLKSFRDLKDYSPAKSQTIVRGKQNKGYPDYKNLMMYFEGK